MTRILVIKTNLEEKKKKNKTVCIIELIKHGVHLLEKDISPPPSCGFFFLQFPERKNTFVGLRVGFLPGLPSDRLGYLRDTDLAPFFPSDRKRDYLIHPSLGRSSVRSFGR